MENIWHSTNSRYCWLFHQLFWIKGLNMKLVFQNLAFLNFAKVGLRSRPHPPNFTSSSAGEAEKLLVETRKNKSRLNSVFFSRIMENASKTAIDYGAIARNRMAILQAEFAKNGNDEAKARAAASTNYDISGELQISAAVVYTSVKVTDMRYPDGTKLEFDGSGWGVGLGATGSGNVSGTMNVSWQFLLDQGDDIKIQVFFLTGGIGGVEISFWDKHNNPLGVLAGGSIGFGAGSFGGDGQFFRV
jgi:hypothetical protein